MNYCFDNSPLSVLFKNYYRKSFPSLWQRFDSIVEEGRLFSTREVLREIENSSVETLREWAAQHQELFPTPISGEGAFVSQIYGVSHFQQNIELQKILKGGRNADAFVIARAAVSGATVVTMESLKPHGARIPNICDHFRVPWLTLEEFMEREEWRF
jgi:hypothetical protein